MFVWFCCMYTLLGIPSLRHQPPPVERSHGALLAEANELNSFWIGWQGAYEWLHILVCIPVALVPLMHIWFAR